MKLRLFNLLRFLKWALCRHKSGFTPWRLSTRAFGDGFTIDTGVRACKCCHGEERADLPFFPLR